MRQILRANGQVEDLPNPVSIREVQRLIGADTLDTVSLVDRVHVMLLDDLCHRKGLPYNAAATAHYHAKCIPGSNPPPILGDVVIVPDSDFGSDD